MKDKAQTLLIRGARLFDEVLDDRKIPYPPRVMLRLLGEVDDWKREARAFVGDVAVLCKDCRRQIPIQVEGPETPIAMFCIDPVSVRRRDCATTNQNSDCPDFQPKETEAQTIWTRKSKTVGGMAPGDSGWVHSCMVSVDAQRRVAVCDIADLHLSKTGNANVFLTCRGEGVFQADVSQSSRNFSLGIKKGDLPVAEVLF